MASGSAITQLPARRLRVAVVEDQPLTRQHIVESLRRIDGVDVVAACESGMEAVERIDTDNPDLVFLDIEMPEMTGFDVIEAVGVDRMPPVVFVTAYNMYALKAFEVQALDYILKPMSTGRVLDAVNRARKRLALLDHQVLAQHLSSLLNRPEVAGQRDRFAVRAAGRLVFVRYVDIDRVTACGNYAVIHACGLQHTIREPMLSLEARLGKDFKRIHRSTIVNLHRVRELRAAGKGEYDVVLSDGSLHRVTRRFRPALEKALSALH